MEKQLRVAAEGKLDRINFQAQDVVQLLEYMVSDGQKIEAIKLYRQMTGHGLKESKDAIERVTNRFAVVKAA